MKETKYEELSDIQRAALDEASKVLEHSYNPYSHFFVGACLISEKGELIAGTNLENAAYGSCICAERAAILRANAMGIRRFQGIAVTARGNNFDTKKVTAPCGSCRQVLYEVAQLSGGDFEAILSNTRKDKVVITTIKELLPLAFGPLDLGIDIGKY